MKLSRWARATLLTGAILLTIGVVPFMLISAFLPGADPVIFGLIFFLLTPLGALLFCLGVVMYFIAVLRG